MFGVDSAVHPAHVGDGDTARERGQSGVDLRMREQRRGARDDGGVIRREVVAIVLEHDQAVRIDEAAGRVARYQIDLPLRERPIDQREIHGRRRCGKPQSVGARKARVAVLTLKEFVAEAGVPGRSVGCRGRQRLDSQLSRHVAADEHGKRVLEPQRIEQRQAGLRIVPLDPVKDPMPVRIDRLMKNRRLRGARVLDIRVDVAGTQRTVADEGAAEIQSALDADRRTRFDRLRDDFAENDLLGEVL